MHGERPRPHSRAAILKVLAWRSKPLTKDRRASRAAPRTISENSAVRPDETRRKKSSPNLQREVDKVSARKVARNSRVRSPSRRNGCKVAQAARSEKVARPSPSNAKPMRCRGFRDASLNGRTHAADPTRDTRTPRTPREPAHSPRRLRRRRARRHSLRRC